LKKNLERGPKRPLTAKERRGVRFTRGAVKKKKVRVTQVRSPAEPVFKDWVSPAKKPHSF